MCRCHTTEAGLSRKIPLVAERSWAAIRHRADIRRLAPTKRLVLLSGLVTPYLIMDAFDVPTDHPLVAPSSFSIR